MDLQSIYYGEFGIIFSLVPIICLFWATYALLINKSRTHSQIFLAIFFVALGISIGVSSWYDRYESLYRTEVLRAVNPILSSSCAVFAYFYLTALMKPQRLTSRFIRVHLFGIIIYSVVFTVLLHKYGSLEHISSLFAVVQNISQSDVLTRVLSAFFLLVFETYAVISCICMFRSYQQFIRNRYSYDEEISLRWVLYCFIILVTYAIIDLGWIIFNTVTVKVTFYIASTLIAIFLFYLGFRQKDIFAENTDIIDECPLDKANSQQASIDIVESEVITKNQSELRKQLEAYFEDKKPYLNSSLSLNDVATDLKSNRTYLSQLINQEYHQNFYAFVNHYRIKYAIRLLEETGNKYSLEYIREISGFKSKSVFYDQFKEYTGSTPSTYLEDKKN